MLFRSGVRRWNLEAYAEWAAVLLDGAAGATARDPVGGSEQIGPEERLAEQVYLGLRTTDGLGVLQNELSTVTSWIDAGWAVIGELVDGAATLRLTPDGWLRLDALAAALTAVRSRSLSSPYGASRAL